MTEPMNLREVLSESPLTTLKMIYATKERKKYKGYLAVKDPFNFLDISSVLTKFDDAGWFIKEIDLLIKKDAGDNDIFAVEIFISGAGTLCVESYWNIWQASSIKNVVKKFIKPIYQNSFEDKLLVDGVVVKSAEEALQKIVEQVRTLMTKDDFNNITNNGELLDEIISKIAA